MAGAPVRYLLDANVLLRLAQSQHPQHTLTLAALRALAYDGTDVCIVPQCLYKFWAVATRPVVGNGLGLSPAQTIGWLTHLHAAFQLFQDTPAILMEWERIVGLHGVQGKQTHDARLVAAMKAHGLTHLLTFNARHFHRFAAGENIVVVDPQTVATT